jgi:hypothetical protein
MSTPTSDQASKTLQREHADLMARAEAGRLTPSGFERLAEIHREAPSLRETR